MSQTAESCWTYFIVQTEGMRTALDQPPIFTVFFERFAVLLSGQVLPLPDLA